MAGTFAPTTYLVDLVNNIRTTLDSEKFRANIREAATAKWTYVTLSSDIVEGIPALLWVVRELWEHALFREGFRLLVRGQTDTTPAVFELCICWGTCVPDIQFLESDYDNEAGCEWGDNIDELEDVEIEEKRLLNPSDVVNTLLASMYRSPVTTYSAFYNEIVGLASADIATYTPTEFNLCLVDSLGNKISSALGCVDLLQDGICVEQVGVWPFDGKTSIETAWVLSVLSKGLPENVMLGLVSTPDVYQLALMRNSGIVCQLDV